MNKFSTFIILFLLAIIGFGAHKFIFQGSVTKGSDNRTAIVLSTSERQLILEEMRGFLTSTQQIIQAVADDEMAKLVTAAKKSGRAAQAEVPTSLVGKLPMAFKKLGFDTHTKFDELAMDAEDMEDSQQSLKLLSQLMQNCIGCHATYQLVVEKK